MKKLFRYLTYTTLLTVLLYLLIAYIFTLFPKKTSVSIQEKKYSIYLLYNSIHTDILLNVKEFNLSELPIFMQKNRGYLSFGWGDQEVYLNSPNLSDITFTSTLKALFLNTPSLIHVSYLPHISNREKLKTIKLSKAQIEELKKSILQSFVFPKKRYRGYNREDFFYEAKGFYNLFNTCNTWTGDRLRDANVTMPYWTPFVWSVTSALP